MNESLRLRVGNTSVHHLTHFEHGVVVAQFSETAAEAARRLRDYQVGCVVLTCNGKAAGILTDRDLALRVVAEGRDPNATLLSDIVTYDATTVSRGAGIETAIRLMREHGVRRLPIVTDDGQVTGIVTADDLIAHIAQQLTEVATTICTNAEPDETR